MKPARLAAPLAAGLVMAATLYPAYGAPTASSPWCLTCDRQWVADFLANILLFLPLGAALGLSGRKIRTALIGGALLSIMVELLQNVVPGRTPGVRDVLSNTLGAGLGAFLVVGVPRALLLPRTTRRLCGGGLLLAGLATVLVGGWLTRPSPPRAPVRALWRPVLDGHPGPYRGRLLEVRVGGVQVGDGEEVPRGAFAHVRLGGAPLTFRVRWMGRPWGRRMLFSFVAPDGEDEETVEVDRRAVVVADRTPGSRIGLRMTDTWIPDLLPPDTLADPLRLTLAHRPGRICAVAGGRESCARVAPLGRAWTLFQSQGGVPDPLLPLVDAVWLAGLFIPAGLLLRGALLGSMAGTALGVLAVPPLFALPAASPWEAVCVALGILIGGALQPLLSGWARTARPLRAPPAARGPARPGSAPSGDSTSGRNPALGRSDPGSRGARWAPGRSPPAGTPPLGRLRTPAAARGPATAPSPAPHRRRAPRRS